MRTTRQFSQTDTYDLTSCDREPIHILGHVQSFGCLIMVSSDWLITHASRNCAEFLGRDAESLIGTRFADLFAELPAHKLRGATQALNAPDQGARLFAFELFEDGRQFDISVHRSANGFCFEFERKDNTSDALGDLSLVRSLIARVSQHDDLDALASDAVRALRGLTGFDRVLIYKFLLDGTGETIAESCGVGMCRYLGLRFPASDIPKQARELYRRNYIRLIADVDAPPSEIIPGRSPEGEPPDLSMAVTRSVSPVHLEYLRNMDVADQCRCPSCAGESFGACSPCTTARRFTWILSNVARWSCLFSCSTMKCPSAWRIRNSPTPAKRMICTTA